MSLMSERKAVKLKPKRKATKLEATKLEVGELEATECEDAGHSASHVSAAHSKAHMSAADHVLDAGCSTEPGRGATAPGVASPDGFRRLPAPGPVKM